MSRVFEQSSKDEQQLHPSAAETDWNDLSNCNPVKDLESLLGQIKDSPEPYGKKEVIHLIKALLPGTHSENLDSEIETIQ
jgi:hypothetical protein